jgi:hypothetical protein
MQFGNSLARLATDIVGGHDARRLSARAREATLSELRAVTWRTISANTAHRAMVASELSAAAATLRRNLEVSRRDAVDAMRAFRGKTRAERAAAARTLAASLSQFVAGVSSETLAIRNAVQSELTMARASWGSARPPGTVAHPAPIVTASGAAASAVATPSAAPAGAHALARHASTYFGPSNLGAASLAPGPVVPEYAPIRQSL